MKIIAILFAVLLLPLAGGCGDDGDSNGKAGSTTPTGAGGSEDAETTPVNGPLLASSLGKMEYIKRANEICSEVAEKRFDDIIAYSRKHGDESEAKRLAGAVRAVIVPSMETLVDKLRKLGAPARDKAEVEAILRTFALIPATTRRTDEESLNNADVGLAIVRARTAGRKYGLTSCDFR